MGAMPLYFLSPIISIYNILLMIDGFFVSAKYSRG